MTVLRLFPRIAEAASYRGCPLSAASPLIALEVAPPPALSQNLSGSPLVTVRLQHTLVSSSASARTCVFDLVSRHAMFGVRVLFGVLVPERPGEPAHWPWPGVGVPQCFHRQDAAEWPWEAAVSGRAYLAAEKAALTALDPCGRGRVTL